MRQRLPADAHLLSGRPGSGLAGKGMVKADWLDALIVHFASTLIVS
jgi:hypothetical protein